MREKLNFVWESFHEHTRAMLQNMMSSKFSDVTLVCEDRKKIPAHRNFLSACSPVLRDILEDIDLSDLKHPIIYLKGIKYQEMKSILDFSYMGQVNILSEKVEDFLSSAKSLEIEGLNTENDAYEQKGADETKEEITVDEDINKDNDETFSKNDEDMGYFGFGSIPDDNLDQSKENGQSVRPSKDGEAKFNCNECNRSYFNRRSVWLHRKNAHGGTQYSCDECDFVTEKAMNLKVHVRTKHDISYKIRFENYSTKSCASPKDTGLKDQNTNTTIEENETDEPTHTHKIRKKKYKCNKCDFKSEIQSDLIKHMKTHLKKISFKNEQTLPGKFILNPKKAQ